MAHNLTRKDLYNLVWAKPRSEIAKQFEISDVRLGKICRDLNVPAPPRGYWASAAARRRKRRYIKPPLTYTVAERIEEDHAAVWTSLPDVDPKNFDQPIPPPPVMPYSREEALERYKLLVDQVATPKVTRGLHTITEKFVAEDERLAELSKQYSWYQPRFASPVGKQLLEGLNKLLWFWTDLGLKPRTSGTRNIGMWISRGGFGSSFEITHTSLDDAHGGRPRKRGLAGFEFWFDRQTWERHSKQPTLVFPTFTRDVLRSLSLLVIEHWEDGFRASVKRSYDWKVDERVAAIKEFEQARKREREKRAAEVQALLDSRLKLLEDALSRSVRSDAIRALVRDLEDRIGARAEQAPAFQHWRRWALAEADCDPRAQSLAHLNEWFDKFRLDE